MSRQKIFIFLISCMLLAVSCSKEPLDTSVIAKATNNPQMEQELLGMVNEHRISLGYASLEFSPVAYSYASDHTDYMIAKGSLSHDNFSARASGISNEVNAEYVAENVAKDYLNAQEAFNSWMASPNHRKTLEGEFTHTAVSVKKDAAGSFYYTQLFFR